MAVPRKWTLLHDRVQSPTSNELLMRVAASGAANTQQRCQAGPLLSSAT